MASNYTRPKGLRPDTPALEGSDAEPAVVAPMVATSSTADTFEGISVAAAGEPESMSTEPAGPVSAPPSLRQRECFLPRADPVC